MSFSAAAQNVKLSEHFWLRSFGWTQSTRSGFWTPPSGGWTTPEGSLYALNEAIKYQKERNRRHGKASVHWQHSSGPPT